MKTTKTTISKAELREQIMGAVKVAQQEQTLKAVIDETEAIMHLVADQQRQLLDRLLEHKVEYSDDYTSLGTAVPVQAIKSMREGL